MPTLPPNKAHGANCDESSSLLSSAEAQARPPVATPLPRMQLAALCSVRLVDPVAFTQVFPYVNEFITFLDITDNPAQIGFYSGLVESTFALAQLFSIYQWAKLSDVVGRRPVVIGGTLGLVITTAFLGISSSLPELLLSRCLAGLFSGNVAVIHSVLGEITDSTNQALAFPIYGIFWPLGAIIGPLIGGSLSNPATKSFTSFDVPLFRTFPYLLPCLVAALLGFCGVVLAYYFLDETLPSKRTTNIEKGTQVHSSYGATDDHGTATIAPPPISISTLLSMPTIRALSVSGFALCFIATAFDVVFVLFCYSPIATGGLGFSASQIGYSLATAGAISAGIQLLFMPTLLRTFEITRLYEFCMNLWPLTFAALPCLNLLARSSLDAATGSIDPTAQAEIWIGIALVLGTSRVGCLAYSISMILVKEHAPSPSSLGSTNGLVQFSMCLARAIAPAFVSSAFAISVETSLLGGNLYLTM
ncbi:putative MFS general substrate transporter [Lyophyllum shimeji]|uniref:MFS general substrate transporter n=1 Tax=Lyophyllum shimeji TaxID=47721 RepID=A0A9P3UL09_LYOSH|nr:putative MFS general substrate transporter [Lyophyllum shimeji]